MDGLTVLHKKVGAKEREYVKFKGVRQHKIRLPAEYKTGRHIFDKEMRIQERKYKNQIVLKLEQIDIRNCKEFWKYTKILGPTKMNKTPKNTLLGYEDNKLLI